MHDEMMVRSRAEADSPRIASTYAQSLTPEGTELREPFLAAQVTCGSKAPIARARSHVKDADGNEETRTLPGNGQVLNGRLQSEGESELTVQQVFNVEWSHEKARIGDEVTISGSTSGLEDGTEVMVRVDQLTSSGEGSDTVYVTTATVSGEKVETTWSYGQTFDGEPSQDVDDDKPVSDQMPVYRAEIVFAETGASCRSGLLTFQDRYRMQALSHPSNEPVPDVPYKLLMSNGETREGKTDADGWLDEEDVPPGDHKVLW